MTVGAYVAGLGLWAPGVPGPQAWLSGHHAPAEVEPRAALLPAKLARRTSLFTRMVFEAFAQAAGTADHTAVPTVFGTTYGEFETLLALLQMLWTDGEISPTRFHNSVYNTAGGYLSIATKNTQFTTTIAAGCDTVAMALLEGLTLLEDRGGNVVIVVGDESPQSPFAPWAGSSLAVSIHLTHQRPPGECFGRLANLRQERIENGASIPEQFQWNPAGLALPLLRLLQRRETGVVPLSRGTEHGWLIDVLPAGDGT